MTEVTNSICNSDVSVSGYSGIHVPHQSCRGMHLPKNLIWSMEHMYQFHPEHSLERGFGVFSRIDVRLWLRCWESFSCRKAHQCPQFRCQPRAVWWLQGWHGGGTALSPVWVALCQCPQGRALQQLRGCQGTPAAWDRSFGFERQCCRKAFMCSYLGRSSSNSLTRYL